MKERKFEFTVTFLSGRVEVLKCKSFYGLLVKLQDDGGYNLTAIEKIEQKEV